MAQTAHRNTTTTPPAQPLFVALELSSKTWKVAFTTGRAAKVRVRDVKARDLAQLLVEVSAAKTAFGLVADHPVRSCYEAGRDGFWIHRALASHGIENSVLDSSSIEVDRRARQTKTDGLDVRRLVRLLVRLHEGDLAARVVHVPSAEVEDDRVLPRALSRLKGIRTKLTNAIRGALMRHGIDLDPRRKSFRGKLTAARQWDGTPLPPAQRQEIDLLAQQLELVEEQITEIDAQQQEAVQGIHLGEAEGNATAKKAALLCSLRGVGVTSAFVLAAELMSRQFQNRGQVGALAGLTGTPFCSGKMKWEQGISKAGNSRVRSLMVQLAWLWRRYQPHSKLSKWFDDYVGRGGSRSKRKAIVALARKLLIALWRFVEHGVVPEGAVLKAEPAQAVA